MLHDAFIDTATWNSYRLFKEQKNRFAEELLRAESDITLRANWTELTPKYISKRANWWIGFVPNSWGVFKQGWYGVHFGFMYYRDRNTGVEYVRFPVGVEKPLKTEFHARFKEDVVRSLKQQSIDLPGCAIWPNVGFRKAKLIEPTLVVLDNNAWEKVLKKY